MTEQLVNLTEEDNFYKKYIENGTTTQKGVSLSRATAYLGNANTIPKYYKTNLNNIRRANTPLLKERALKSVKKIGDSWRLKLQLSKYPHPLFIDDFGNPFSLILSDKDGTIAITLGAYGVPETTIINKDKKIIKKFVGSINNKDTISEIEFILKWKY